MRVRFGWKFVIRMSSVGVTPGVVLHEIRQLRQILDWVPAINLISFNQSQVNQTIRSHPDHLKTREKISWTSIVFKNQNCVILIILSSFEN